MLIGIDEAGRGPIMGPLVMAAVKLTQEQSDYLATRGITDSKRQGSGNKAILRRRKLRQRILNNCTDHVVLSFPARVVDEWVETKGLNALERFGARKLLEAIAATPQDEIMCDGEGLFTPLQERYPNLRAENKADGRYISVSAASILAKHDRDAAMDEIARKYQAEFGALSGGGYLNPATEAFLRAYKTAYGELPPEARKSWSWEAI